MQRTMAAIALLSILAMPVAASAQTPTSETHYETKITAVYGSKYPLAGHLTLQFYQSGIIHGYYWPAFQKNYIQLTGGRDGNYIWFNVGPSPDPNLLDLGSGPAGTLHFVGSMNSDGSFSGQVYPQYAASLSGTEMLQSQIASGAQPQPTTNDQYTFTATPEVKTAQSPAP